jgi:hypothetical protein
MSYISRLSPCSFALSCGILLGISIHAAADTRPAAEAATPSASDAVQTAPPGHADTAIEVHGIGKPDDIPYRSFVDAMHTFDQYHHYAPEAPLLFSAHNHNGNADGLRISITGPQVWIPVAVDTKGRFTLPIRQDALDDKAVVISNVRDGEINWGVVVQTPGLPEGIARLGDLRLACRVDSALIREQTSLWVATLTRVFGGCNSDGHMVGILKRPGMRVRFSYPGREEILPDRYYISHHTKWTMPLTDGDWPDDTQVEFLEPDSNFVLD